MKQCHVLLILVYQYDPDHLPREHLLETCLHVVATSPIDVQQAATEAVLEVARAANGDIGATEALPAEVTTLLRGLESPALAVRDVALQVCGLNKFFFPFHCNICVQKNLSWTLLKELKLPKWI